jgi:hypothetical protein
VFQSTITELGGFRFQLSTFEVQPGWYQLFGSFGECEFEGHALEKPQEETDYRFRIVGSLDLSNGVRISGTLCFSETGVTLISTKPQIKFPDEPTITLKQESILNFEELFGVDSSLLRDRLELASY